VDHYLPPVMVHRLRVDHETMYVQTVNRKIVLC